jgi:Tfp pilus assembly protein PilV
MMRHRPGRIDNEKGSSIIEMLVSTFIMIIFMLSVGTAYLVNQTSYRRNTEKLQLQQSATYILEEMEKKIRLGSTVLIPVANRLQVFDQNGVEITRFRLSNVGPNIRLFEQNSVIATQELIALTFVLDPTGSAVQITVTLQDKAKNNVTMKASAALRNSVVMRNIQS